MAGDIILIKSQRYLDDSDIGYLRFLLCTCYSEQCNVVLCKVLALYNNPDMLAPAGNYPQKEFSLLK